MRAVPPASAFIGRDDESIRLRRNGPVGRARHRSLRAAIDVSHPGPAVGDRRGVSANDSGRTERAEAELDALVSQLSEAFSLGGRPRATGSAVERARSAVTWRIRTAIKRVGEVHPELGRHLGNAVRTGTWCAYRPELPVAWSTSRTAADRA
jgi:hypothetical protein